jgi:NIMA-interacting peptidyl-prolyl cis-trans isomerase 4
MLKCLDGGGAGGYCSRPALISRASPTGGEPAGDKEQKVANALKVRRRAPGRVGGRALTAVSVAQLRHCLCEKQSKSLEALAKLKEGVSFDKVSSAGAGPAGRSGGC